MNKKIKEFFYANKYSKIDGLGVFVYNDYNTYHSSDPHIEECFDMYECQEVRDAFEEIFTKTMLYPSEEKFIIDLEFLKHKNVFVYTMAQFTRGYASRALIPALCEYYGFKNVNADTYTSVIGVNKKCELKLAGDFNKFFPFTNFISFDNINDLTSILKMHSSRIVIKPDCESCCIDVQVFYKDCVLEIEKYCKNLLRKYKYLILQDFIVGREIGVTVVNLMGEFIALKPVEIIYKSNKDYLTNLDSRYNNLTFKFTQELPEMSKIAIEIAKELDFTGISRFDFRLCEDNNFYLFDISPNPTMSKGSSSNLAFIDAVDGDYKSIYQFLVFNSLKPPFNSSKHN